MKANIGIRKFAFVRNGLVLIVTALAMLAPRVHAADSERPTLFIIGDSTVRNSTRGQVGWGDPIQHYFDTNRLKVENDAIGGRSSRTFLTEGRWDKVLAEAKHGDFVLMQFGHNDAGPLDDTNRARGTIRGIGEETKDIFNPIRKTNETVHTYGWYMRKYIKEAKAKGMTPIVCSPVPRCPQKTVEPGDEEKNEYVGFAREVAKSEDAGFIELNRIIMSHYVGMTSEEIRAKYFTPADHTHASPAGAELNASCVVEGLRGLRDCPLAGYLLDKPAVPATAKQTAEAQH